MFLLQPQFFDIFGAIAFIYIIFFSIRGLFGKQILWGIFGKKIPNWALITLLSIGIMGLIIDSLVIYTFYLK
jgi:hypothetical protein